MIDCIVGEPTEACDVVASELDDFEDLTDAVEDAVDTASREGRSISIDLRVLPPSSTVVEVARLLRMRCKTTGARLYVKSLETIS